MSVAGGAAAACMARKRYKSTPQLSPSYLFPRAGRGAGTAFLPNDAPRGISKSLATAPVTQATPAIAELPNWWLRGVCGGDRERGPRADDHRSRRHRLLGERELRRRLAAVQPVLRHGRRRPGRRGRVLRLRRARERDAGDRLDQHVRERGDAGLLLLLPGRRLHVDVELDGGRAVGARGRGGRLVHRPRTGGRYDDG